MRQLLDSEALNHICALATEHNADLPQWCARRRRYEAFRRMAVAACFFALLAVGADTVYARPPLYTEIYTCGNIDNDHACKTIDYMLNH
jgi:hypothetical protein